MRIYILPYEPDTFWGQVPALCPACQQGILMEEDLGPQGETVWVCFSQRGPSFCCHTRYTVDVGTPRGGWADCEAVLRRAGVWPPFDNTGLPDYVSASMEYLEELMWAQA